MPHRERRPGALVVVLIAARVLLFADGASAQGSELVEACYRAVNAGTDEIACQLCEKAVVSSTGADRTVALINLGRCEEGRGKLLRALEAYQQAKESMAPDDERVSAVSERIRVVDARLPRLRLDGTRLPPGATVTFDEVVLATPTQELRADPGEHVAVVRVIGRDDRAVPVLLGEGQTVSLALEAAPAPDQKRSSGLHAQAIAGIIVGSVGVLGLIAFGVTGGLALDRQATFDERCPAPEDGMRTCEDPEALDAADEGRTLNIVNAVSLGVGAAGVVAGLVLFFTAPDEQGADARLVLEVSPLGLGLRGAF